MASSSYKGNKRDDLVYPELSYKIVGAAFETYNEIGPGHLEKYYQKGLSIEFEKNQLKFAQQVKYDLLFKGERIGKGVIDFIVEDKIVVKIKKDVRFSKAHLLQVLNYLKLSQLKPALLINFTKEEVIFKRIVNLNQEPAQN
jgi:GxxExxY protein